MKLHTKILAVLIEYPAQYQYMETIQILAKIKNTDKFIRACQDLECGGQISRVGNRIRINQ